MHRRLACDSRGQPRVRIMENCTNLVRTLPTLPLSKNNPEDVDTKADDHAYDALRYMMMVRSLHNASTPYYSSRQMQRYVPENEVFGY